LCEGQLSVAAVQYR